VRDLDRLRSRFERNAGPARIASIASELNRLATWVRLRRSDRAIADMLREIAWLMEWTDGAATVELANMQRELCRWRRAWPVEAARSVLELRARQMAVRLAEMSGLGHAEE
jgi:hypothetical protein